MSRRAPALAVLAAVLTLTACSGAPAAPAAPAADVPAEHQGHTPGQAGHTGHGGSPDRVELWAVQTAPLGVVVTDGAGAVLYRYDRDSAQPPASTCVDACAATWTPVMVGAQPPELLGVDPGRVGSVRRADGGEQMTIGGWPVYRKAGEGGGLQGTGSNGADGAWFAIAPDGTKAKPA